MVEPSEATSAGAGETAIATTKVTRKSTKRAATTPKHQQSSSSNTPAKKKTKTTTTGSNTSSTQKSKPKQRSATASTAATRTAPTIHSSHSNLPTRTLILDNGGDTIKYGWATNRQQQTAEAEADAIVVQRMPNLTARLPQQLTVLVGDQVQQLQNPNSVWSTERSTERTIITHLGNQVQVWKRILDLLKVTIPTGTATAAALGWTGSSSTTTVRGSNKTKSSSKSSQHPHHKSPASTGSIPSHACAVLLALPPHYPHSVLEHILQIWWHDFGFARVGFCLSIVAAAATIVDPQPAGTTNMMAAPPASTPNEQPTQPTTTTTISASSTSNIKPQHNCALMVDLGWSATHICPVYNHRPITNKCLRRIPLGGRHLINLWKYYASYRQWNMMDQEWVMRDVWEQTAYVSLDFIRDCQTARRIPAGRRPFDLEYVLPDYSDSPMGRVQIPWAVQKQNEQQARRQQQANNHERDNKPDEEDDEDDDDDEDFSEKDVPEDDDDDDENVTNSNLDDDKNNSDGDSSDEEENEEQLRQRLLRERQEQERRRREQEAEQQVLHVSVERFAVPEVLFRPSDAGLPREWANLPQAVVQSIEACPLIYRAALYQSIHLTGGLSQLTHIAERLEQEVRALAPAQYKLVKVTASSKANGSPMEAAWRGANRLATMQPCGEWSVIQEEGRGAWKRLLWGEGGHLV